MNIKNKRLLVLGRGLSLYSSQRVRERTSLSSGFDSKRGMLAKKGGGDQALRGFSLNSLRK